jgi:CelD/BcsL family acetyltransferase involved in cellulose biosynthesis
LRDLSLAPFVYKHFVPTGLRTLSASSLFDTDKSNSPTDQYQILLLTLRVGGTLLAASGSLSFAGTSLLVAGTGLSFAGESLSPGRTAAPGTGAS